MRCAFIDTNPTGELITSGCPLSSRKGYTARSFRAGHSEGDSSSVHRQNYNGERWCDNLGF